MQATETDTQKIRRLAKAVYFAAYWTKREQAEPGCLERAKAELLKAGGTPELAQQAEKEGFEKKFKGLDNL